MTIADREEVSPAVFAEMRKHQVRVLINLVRVLGAKAGFRCKTELGHAIVELLRSRIVVLSIIST